MKNQNQFLEKYLKYKTKYLELKKTLEGGGRFCGLNCKDGKHKIINDKCKKCECINP